MKVHAALGVLSEAASMHVDDYFVPLRPCCALQRIAGHAHLHMVIAPHPDDDVIGAGGMMALFARSRYPVVVVYVTDGVQAGRGRSDTARIRRNEALAALHVLRARGAFFLPFTSQDVHMHPRRVRFVLLNIIRQAVPAALYTPCPFERHATHRAVTNMLVGCLCGQIPYTGELWGYSVWSALPPSSYVRGIDITRVADLKRAAIEQHASQVSVKDYAGGILGLNRYAAVFSSLSRDTKHVRYIEQFLDMRMLLRSRAMSMPRFASMIVAQEEASQCAEPGA